ncbi:MAG: hypothetical protein A2Z91_05765 [Deltaproteobacteria bacterium GWA2_38_16]|nr:MAG: hypothetical protein A2Z91_05765 [Deltaproteobacteria bacterium GWA2_38_16]OGQ02619.1 MAG: hypothetical protein A3D19_05060 [Deltaproteobacteria bacterium RIFCSPHIGHO2_02_FULL_38_15]OGQ34772.1 MAG: hypothetical protein A3A72_05225 [Deltaproteobacteria bacterium RIFCSPLOWO2_01_FULL_38_9]OGQ61537.1 MAG: hypothetical protein A3G92_00060 [Deltaproteobacteria bacterium RIFCSPLOWO2_12_FULL_38_8]HBQ20318.1 hypothetical protein [Deltaproteobacteria bacterium]
MFKRFFFSFSLLLIFSISGWTSVQTYFSPHGGAHDAIVRDILEAKKSIDIAMYNFSSSKILGALQTVKKKKPRIAIRMIFDDAANTEGDAPGATSKSDQSEALEHLGVDIRYVSKIMHHKFVIIDGFPDGLKGDEDFSHTVLLNGSGNFSSRADTGHDENLAEIRNEPEITTDFQKEFQLMWNYSYDFPDDSEQSDRPSYQTTLSSSPSIAPVFTSSNFKTTVKFPLNGNRVVSWSLESAIRSAKKSIYVATGHFRLKPLADALIEAKKENPNLDIRVILDTQEHITPRAHEEQMSRYRQRPDELAGKMKFSRYLSEGGIDTRIKYAAYIFYYAIDPQMHHKYMVIDGTDVWSGSYNWSRNAEFNTFENVVHYSGEELSEVAQSYTENFLNIWDKNRDSFQDHKRDIQKQSRIPLHFDPMSLWVSEIDELYDLLEKEVPGFFEKIKPEDMYWAKRKINSRNTKKKKKRGERR